MTEARQMAALEAAGPEVALSYAWYLIIDEHGKLLDKGPRNQLQRTRDTLPAQMEGNFIGNGSSTIIRRERIDAAGGYDPSLRARGAEGCEDQKLYIALAERWDFVAVSRYLIAYRNHPMSMSRDSARMARSHALVVNDLRSRRPDLSSYRLGRGMARSHEAGMVAALRGREWASFVHVLARAAGDGKWCLFDLLGRRLTVSLLPCSTALPAFLEAFLVSSARVFGVLLGLFATGFLRRVWEIAWRRGLNLPSAKRE